MSKLVNVIEESNDEIISLCGSQDGRNFASGGMKHYLNIWKTPVSDSPGDMEESE